MAKGICNVQSLCRIENNRAGISPGTFQALTSKCGASTEVFPLFASWDDYECFHEMCKVDMWLQAWQVGEASYFGNRLGSRGNAMRKGDCTAADWKKYSKSCDNDVVVRNLETGVSLVFYQVDVDNSSENVISVCNIESLQRLACKRI